NANYTAITDAGQLTLSPAAPAFRSLTAPQTIGYGTPTVTLGGTLAAGSVPATGSVAVTLDGAEQTAPLDPSGNFSTTFNTATLSSEERRVGNNYRNPEPTNFVDDSD